MSGRSLHCAILDVYNRALSLTLKKNMTLFGKGDEGKLSEIINLVIPATRITARVSVVSSELSVRTRAAISQTTGSKLKKKGNKI